MKKDFLKSLSEKKKLKYGALLASFTAIIIAIIIAFNSIISILADNFHWFFDMTEEQSYTLSKAFKETLDNQIDGKAEIEIIFCCDKDEVERAHSITTEGGGVNTQIALSSVHTTATQIADRVDNVKVSYKDTRRDHTFFKENGWIDKAKEYSVLVARRFNDGYGQVFFWELTDFYSVSNNELYGYDAEYVFATSLVALVADETPFVYFIKGNGEDLSKCTAFKSLFEKNGFLVKEIDLDDDLYVCSCGETYPSDEVNTTITTFKCTKCQRESEIAGMQRKKWDKIPESARAVIAYEPTFDYTESEIALLEDYLVGEGSLIFFASPTAPQSEMVNLYGDPSDDTKIGFLESWAGVTVDNSSYLMKDGDINGIRGNFVSNDATSAYFPDLVKLSNTRPYFDKTGSISIDSGYEAGVTLANAVRQTLSLFATDTSVTQANNARAYNLLTITSSRVHVSGAENPTISYLLCGASGEFVSDDNLNNNNAPNKKVMTSLITQLTRVQTANVEIDTKPFADYTLDLELGEKQAWMIVLCTVPTLIIIGVMLVVIIRRKRR